MSLSAFFKKSFLSVLCFADQKYYEGVNNQTLPQADGSLREQLFRDVVFTLIPLKEKLVM